MSTKTYDSHSQQTEVSLTYKQPTDLLPVEPTFTNYVLTRNILDAATRNPEFASRLFAEPSDTFLASGMTLSSIGGLRADFNDYFREVAGPVIEKIQESHASNRTTSLEELEAENGLLSTKCTACKIGVYGVAGTIVAVGVVALASLTEVAPVVLGVASLFGISKTEALAYVKSLLPQIKEGASAVALALCQKLGPCNN